MTRKIIRTITSHKIPGQDHSQNIEIRVLDEPGQGNANHKYEIENTDISAPACLDFVTCRISFQNGPVKERGTNGISNEALLAVVIDRLQGFQSGEFSCRENAVALTHIETAMLWLSKRTLDRLARGVEGENIK